MPYIKTQLLLQAPVSLYTVIKTMPTNDGRANCVPHAWQVVTLPHYPHVADLGFVKLPF